MLDYIIRDVGQIELWKDESSRLQAWLSSSWFYAKVYYRGISLYAETYIPWLYLIHTVMRIFSNFLIYSSNVIDASIIHFSAIEWHHERFHIRYEWKKSSCHDLYFRDLLISWVLVASFLPQARVLTQRWKRLCTLYIYFPQALIMLPDNIPHINEISHKNINRNIYLLIGHLYMLKINASTALYKNSGRNFFRTSYIYTRLKIFWI